MPFFKKTSKRKVIAVIDITSLSVGGALMESNEGCPIVILVTPKSPVNFLFDVSLEASLRCTADPLRLTAKKLKNLYSGRIDEVLCVFSSPWFVSKTKIVTVTGKKQFEIKNDFFSKLIEEEEKKFISPVLGVSGGARRSKAECIEHEVIKTELNGYYTKSPAGKTARSVKSYIYLSMGAEKAMELAKKEIANFFVNTPLRFATSSLVVFKVLNDIISNKEGFLIIDIGGETTEINLIRNNAPEQSASFPKGTNLLFRKVAVALNTFLQEASSVVKAYSRGHRTLESSDKIAAAIKDSIREWRDYLKNSLAVMSKENLLPQNVFVVGDDPVCNFFSSFLENSELSEFTVLKKPFAARKVNPEWLLHYFNPDISMTQSSQNFKKCETGDYQHKDIMLMIEAIYANNFLEIRN